MKGKSKKFKVPNLRSFWSSRPFPDLPSAPPTERPTESQSAPPTEIPIHSHSTPLTGRPTNSQSKSPPELGPSDSGSGADIEGQPHQPQKNVSIPWKAMRTALRALEKNSDGLPPLKAAVGLLVACLDLTIDVIHNREEYDRLALELAAMANDLEPHAEQLLERGEDGSVARIIKSINEELTQIKDKLDRSKLKRAIDTSGDKDDIVNRYRKIDSLFRRLLSDITLRTHIEIRKLRDATDATLLRTLEPVHDARYNSAYSTAVNRRGCTASTREQILQTLRTWADDPTGAKVFWLNGMAGTGKTTILYTFCQWLEENSRLGGNFFCSRGSGSCRSLNKILPSLAYQLAHYSPAFRSQLCTVLEDQQSPQTLNVGSQFKWVLETPLEKSKEAIPEGVVIVVDALDECESALEARLFLETLLKLVHRLPVKIIIASRPEPIIVTKMQSPGFSSSTIHLHDIEQLLVEADIGKYLEEALSSMSPPPSPSILDELARRSGKLFIYAATVARYVNPEAIKLNLSERRLQAIMDITSPTSGLLLYQEIDYLYTKILDGAFNPKEYEHKERENAALILRTVVCAMEPLSTQTLSVLLALKHEEVENTLSRLRSVLHVQEGPTGVVSILHASFPDFMFDESRSLHFHCNPGEFHMELSSFCFDVMGKELRFNICDLETSFLFDSDVPDLQQKIERNISDALFYSCKHWGNHLVRSIFAEDIHTKLVCFLETRLLFWMEVLNVTRHITTGPKLLRNALNWLKKNTLESKDSKKLYDAKEFIEAFSMAACSESTPHIYMSALPFLFKSNFVYENYWPKTQGLIRVNGSSLNEKRSGPIATWHMFYLVDSIAFSHNGTIFAAGSSDGVRIYDADSCKIITGPGENFWWTGLVDYHFLVTFSPDDSKLASAYTCLATYMDRRKNCASIWDVQTGELIVGPLQEHIDHITSLSFSSDSKKLVSGDMKGTIIVWDSATGDIISGPFHSTSGIKAVGFTPDGFKIASVSADCRICFWETEKGAILSGPVKAIGDEHGTLMSAALSSDRSKIAMGFDSGTILIMDAFTAAVLIGPFNCNQHVGALEFSHDGKNLFSGFEIWDAQTGTLETHLIVEDNLNISHIAITPTPDGHKIISVRNRCDIDVWNIVNDEAKVAGSPSALGLGPCIPVQDNNPSSKLAYSPDGRAIGAVLENGCVGLWDARTGKEILHPFPIYNEGGMVSISFSPDGAHFATGRGICYDAPLPERHEPVRIWDACTGNMIDELLAESLELGPVNAVTYSHDGSKIAWSVWQPVEYKEMSEIDAGKNTPGVFCNTIIIWDLLSGRIIEKLMLDYVAYEMSTTFSPDDTILALGAYKEFVMWNVDTCKVIWQERLQLEVEDYVTSIAFSPDGTMFASGLSNGQLCLWNTTTTEMTPLRWRGRSLQHAIDFIAFLADGKKVLTAINLGGYTVQVVDVETGNILAKFTNPQWRFLSVAISLDCSHFVTSEWHCDGSPHRSYIRIWAVEKALATAQGMDKEDTIRSEFDNEDSSDSAFYSPRSVQLTMSRIAKYNYQTGFMKVDNKNIFWTSPDFLDSLCHAYNPLVIGPYGTTLMDYSSMNLCLGKKWVNCWLAQ